MTEYLITLQRIKVYNGLGVGNMIRIMSLNICSGRTGGSEAILQALLQGNFRLGIPQETYPTDGIHMRYGLVCSIWSTEAERLHRGGIAVVWKEEVGWQVERTVNFGPNVVSCLLTSRARIWYVVGAYMPPDNAPAVHQVEQDLLAKPKGIDTIFLEDLNAQLEEPRDDRDKDLVKSLANHGVEDFTRHFTPQRQYRGRGRWTWLMQIEGWQMTGRGEYFLRTAWGYFTNVGLREPRIHTYHRVMLSEIRVEGSTLNSRYRQRRTQCPIQRSIHRPQTKLEAAFDNLKNEVYRRRSQQWHGSAGGWRTTGFFYGERRGRSKRK